MAATSERRRTANRRTGLLLAVVALAFFVAVIIQLRGLPS